MDGLSLDLHVAVGLSRLGFGNEFSVNLYDVAVSILHHTLVDVLGTLDDIAVLESHLFARSESEELLGGIFHEVVALYP